MVTPFQERVYVLTRKIPKGRVTTYAALAHAMGIAGYRSVGTALGRNPDIPATPCHRVVKSNGEVGQYAFNTPKKIAILKEEGVEVVNGKIVNFEEKLFTAF